MRNMVDTIDHVLSVAGVDAPATPASVDKDTFLAAVWTMLESHERRLGRVEAWMDDGDVPDEDTGPERPAQTPPPAPLRHTVDTPIVLAELAHAPVGEWQRQIGQRHGSNASSVRDALLHSPHFAHWREMARQNACAGCSPLCERDGTSVTGCRTMLRLMAEPFGRFSVRYSAVMAGEPDAGLRPA